MIAGLLGGCGGGNSGGTARAAADTRWLLDTMAWDLRGGAE